MTGPTLLPIRPLATRSPCYWADATQLASGAAPASIWLVVSMLIPNPLHK
jgi:hypothetical protein